MVTPNATPTLSAVLIVGPCRERAQRVVDALSTQTAVTSLEIVVVDLAPESSAPLVVGRGVPTTYVRRPGLTRWGHARADAVRAARAPVVAFTEDHCYPAPTWAQALIGAHAGPWAAVGYAFTNANPRSYVSRAALLARYGMFVSPATGGPARYLPGNNVSYRRDLLLGLGRSLDDLLDIDFNLQEALRREGHQLFVEARAISAHENYSTLAGECRAGRPYCRLLASHRARFDQWSRSRRVFYGIVSPMSAPVLRLIRLAASLRARPALWPSFFGGLPLITLMYASDAWGEAAGYLFGAGQSEQAVLKYELETERDS